MKVICDSLSLSLEATWKSVKGYRNVSQVSKDIEHVGPV